MIHYLSSGPRWISETYFCGADAVGRRSTRTDLDPEQTTCPKCLAEPLHPINTGAVELGKIVDKSEAKFMVADLQDGASLSKASMYITQRELKREDFVAFRSQHGDRKTTEALMQLASS